MNQDKQETLLTVAHTAERLSVGRTRVFNWLATGELHGIKVGRSRHILASSVDQFIQRLINDDAN
jgi:excisionase family DNA binding protein